MIWAMWSLAIGKLKTKSAGLRQSVNERSEVWRVRNLSAVKKNQEAAEKPGANTVRWTKHSLAIGEVRNVVLVNERSEVLALRKSRER